MLKRILLAISLMGLMILSTNAGAASFTFSFTGNGINGSGTLDANDNGNGTYTATSGSVTAFLAGGVIYSGILDDTAPSGWLKSGFPYGGGWQYDNLLYSAAPSIDILGLLFTGNGYPTYSELNLGWGDGYGNLNESYSAVFVDPTIPQYAIQPISFDLVKTPIPPALLLLGPGLIGLAGLRRKFQK
jgi:hypothetical protein